MEKINIKYYAAVDIGGSSGRIILGHIENGSIISEEVHRFPNILGKNDEGTLVWNTEALFSEIVTGLAKCKDLGKIPYSVAVDMWGVDFVLLDKFGNLIGDAVSNRDSRTNGIPELFAQKMSDEELYSITGIQKMQLNTVYQLYALKMTHPEHLIKAHTFLMLPDYMTYLLSGNIACEYTNASTTSMLDARTRNWSEKVLKTIGLDQKIMPKIVFPCENAGNLRKEIADKVGFDCKVIYPATHDTGSAVMSVTDSNNIYISSGTWSLVGIESDEPNTIDLSRQMNFTNEGGFGGKIRFLKNIIGLWFIQCVKRELGGNFSYSEMSEMARNYNGKSHKIDVYDTRFLAPTSMIDEVRAACKDENLPIDGVLPCIYHSLAAAYADVFNDIDQITHKRHDTVCIIGGGSQDDYLCELTAEYSERSVVKGVVEATAMGNVMAQAIAAGEYKTLDEARRKAFGGK